MMEADQDGDGKLSFEEFKDMVASTDIAKQMVRRWGFSVVVVVVKRAIFLSFPEMRLSWG